MTSDRLVKLRRLAIVSTVVLSASLWIVSLADLHIQKGPIGWLILAAALICATSFWTAVILTIRMRKTNV